MGSMAEFGGSLLGGIASYAGQREANRTNARIARQATQTNEAMQYRDQVHQLYMSNTAHQRQVEDLEKAGLNPLLSVNSGASTGSGGGGSAATATVENELGAFVTSAMEIKKLNQELDNMKAVKKQVDASTSKTNTENELLKKDVPKAQVIEDVFKKIKKLYERFDSSATSQKVQKQIFNQLR